MNWLKENWFKFIIALLSLYLVVSLKSYLELKNLIEGYMLHSKCIFEVYKEQAKGVELPSAPCGNIYHTITDTPINRFDI